MEKDNQYRIEQYLNNSFSEEERMAFEKELSNDAELRQQLEFAKGMHQFFEDRNPALEENLSRLDEVYFSDNPPKNYWGKIVGGGLFALLVALGAWWLINDVQQNKSDVLPSEINEQKEVEPIIEESATETKTPEPDSKPEEKIIQQPKEEKKPKQQDIPKEEKKETTQPIAMLNPEDFKVNPILEGLIKEKVRNQEITTTLIEPALDGVLKSEGQTLLKIKGTTNAIPPLRMVIYSNKAQDFDNDKPYLNTALSPTQKNEEEYEFQFNAKIDFKKGLYYILIESVEMDELLIVSKFQVK